MKALYDKAAPTKNLITTIAGVVTLVITLLVTFGVFTPEQAAGVTVQTNVLLTAIPEIVSAIAALILIFKAKDA
jgi:protein-S-isoprenylcysteine O-methyltransferase Ste14